MNNYFLKVNFILGYDNKKEIISYELYDNEKLINIYSEDNAREITKIIKDNNIKAKQDGFNYIIDDQKFIKKYFFKAKKRHIKKINLKKAIILSSLATGSILTLVSIKKHKENSNKDINTTIEETTSEETNENLIKEEPIINNNIDTTNTDNIIKENSILNEENNNKNNDNNTINKEPNIDFYFDSNKIDKDIYQFSYENRSNYYDINYVKNNYLNDIINNSNTYGNDPDLIAAIIAQENYDNSKNYSDIGGHGVMQIESIWNGYDITAFNYDINDYETVTVDTMRATDDVEYCIKVGCMIFSNQYNYINDKYNNLSNGECLIATLYSYNKGLTIVDNCLNQSTDFNDFLYQIKNTPYGDNEYSNHVLSYIPDNTKIHLKTVNGEIKEITIDNTIINEENNVNDQEKSPSI